MEPNINSFTTLKMTFGMNSVPDFDALPKVDGMPQGCAWGVFDRDGKKDMVGTLNFLTPDVVKAAASEVKDGVSISLKYYDLPSSQASQMC